MDNNNPQVQNKKKILIVDDDASIASVFQTALNNAGFEVRVAENGARGLEIAAAEAFDLILLDEMMPDMQGNDVLQRLKTDAATKNIKVAMITNFAKEEMIKEAYDRGAVEYILKYQISADDLVKKVQSILQERAEVPEA